MAKKTKNNDAKLAVMKANVAQDFTKEKFLKTFALESTQKQQYDLNLRREHVTEVLHRK